MYGAAAAKQGQRDAQISRPVAFGKAGIFGLIQIDNRDKRRIRKRISQQKPDTARFYQRWQ